MKVFPVVVCLLMLIAGLSSQPVSAQTGKRGATRKPSPNAPAIRVSEPKPEPVKFEDFPGNPRWHGLKAVLIAGGENGDEKGSLYPGFEARLDPFARLFTEQGVRVIRIGRYNSSHAEVVRAVEGAHFILYSGHGNPDAMGLVTASANYVAREYFTPQKIMREFRPAKGVVAIWMGACGSAGTSSGETWIPEEVAKKRVATFSQAFLSFQGCYFAEMDSLTLLRHLFHGETFGDAYLSQARKDHLCIDCHPLYPDKVRWMQFQDGDHLLIWHHAFSGDPGQSLESLFGAKRTEAQIGSAAESPIATWKTLALVYPRLSVRLPGSPNGPPLTLSMTEEERFQTLHALQDLPAAVARAGKGVCRVQLDIKIIDRPLSSLTAIDGNSGNLRPTDKDIAPELAAFNTPVHYDSVIAVWNSGQSAVPITLTPGHATTSGICADIAAGSELRLAPTIEAPDLNNAIVCKWLQSVSDLAGKRGYVTANASAAAQYGYTGRMENWFADLMQGHVQQEGTTLGLSRAVWLAGTPCHPNTAAPCQLLAPLNNAVWEHPPVLHWASPVADRYRVEIVSPLDARHPLFTKETTETTLALPEGCLPVGQIYAWRVIAVRKGQESLVGETRNFALDTLAPPKLSLPRLQPEKLWSGGGELTLSIHARSDNRVTGAVAEILLAPGEKWRVPLKLVAGSSDVWQGTTLLPANAGRFQEALPVTFTATDATGKQARSATLSLPITPWRADYGPGLQVGEEDNPTKPLQGNVALRIGTDRYRRPETIAYVLQLDGKPIASTRKLPFRLDWNSAGVSDGMHTLSVVLINMDDGKTQTSDRIFIQVKNQKKVQ